MKRKIFVIAMSLFVSISAAGCGDSAIEPVKIRAATTTTAETESVPKEKSTSNDLLPFEFTPKVFYDSFSYYADYLDITVDSLNQITDTQYGFPARSSTGDEITVLLSTNSDGKVIIVVIPVKDVSKESISDFIEVSILATDILIDFDELDKVLNFSDIPVTINDYRHYDDRGISFQFDNTGLRIIRDDENQDEYSYTKIQSNPKKETKTNADSAMAATSITEALVESKDVVSELTTGQKNALSKAHDYLSYSAFSYNGLIEQLEYEGFTSEEATYAVDNCGADWNKQAAKKALDYFGYSAFSYSGLIEQLEYEGFSTEEATFAADSCGADWNEQAAKKAQDYLKLSSFSRSGLIDQLKYEGFTNEQAEYGASAAGY